MHYTPLTEEYYYDISVRFNRNNAIVSKQKVGRGWRRAMDASGIAALSELADSLRGDEERRMTREEFETIVKHHFSGSHAKQQIKQLWEKVDITASLM